MKTIIKLKEHPKERCDPLYNRPPSLITQTPPLTKVALKRQFHTLYEKNQADNQRTNEKKSKAIRVATFNVHYWTDLYDKASADKILSDLVKINADILCLQEVSFDRTRYNPYTYAQLMEKFKQMGYCDSVEVDG